MRSLIFALSVLTGIAFSSPAHATTPAERSAMFRAMRTHLTQVVGSTISSDALANMLKQVDRTQARSKNDTVQLSRGGDNSMTLTRIGSKTFELLNIAPSSKFYTTWTFEAMQSRSGSVGTKRERLYSVDKGGWVTKSDHLSVLHNDIVISTLGGISAQYPR